jgi:Reverse transcriptase (RNA-dependent DNA polymerase)
MSTELNDLKNPVFQLWLKKNQIRVFYCRRWVLANKDINNTEMYKDFYVACSNRQDYNMEYAKSFAPRVATESLRIQFSLPKSKRPLIYKMDFKASFLHGKVQGNVALSFLCSDMTPLFVENMWFYSKRVFMA